MLTLVDLQPCQDLNFLSENRKILRQRITNGIAASFMGREEQKEEREVLDSIFPDEITDVSDSEYRISVALESPEQQDEVAAEPLAFVLQVSLPEDYPNVAPNLDVHPSPNHTKNPLLDLSIDKPGLLASLDETISENIGMAMIFTVVSTLKEAAEQLVADRIAAVQNAKEAERAKAEEEENRKFQGEAVTKEKFLEWRSRFRKEMEDKEREETEQREAEEKKKRGGKAEEKRLTGRELFQKGLAGKMMDEDEDVDVETAAATEGIGKVSVGN